MGPDVIHILEKFDRAEVLQLSGDHMAELSLLPPPLPPPPGWPANAPPPTPVPRKHDMPTSVGILVDDYPVVSRATIQDRKPALEVIKLLLSDDMIAAQTGEEALPAPRKAIVFHSGSDSVSLIYDGLLQVYLNDERMAWLALTDQGNIRFEQLYQWLAKAAGLTTDEQKKR